MVVARQEITKTRFHSFPQDFIPHPVLEGGTLVVLTVTLVNVINVATDPLSSKYNTNIFKVAEAVEEVAPEMKVAKDVPKEPECPPVKGIYHL